MVFTICILYFFTTPLDNSVTLSNNPFESNESLKLAFDIGSIVEEESSLVLIINGSFAANSFSFYFPLRILLILGEISTENCFKLKPFIFAKKNSVLPSFENCTSRIGFFVSKSYTTTFLSFS